MALIERGANGSVGGNDCVWLGNNVLPRNVSITGIDNHQITNVPIGTVGAYVMTNRGPVICIFREVAYTGKHKSIISSIQLEHHHNGVDDKHPMLGGTVTISTPDGYILPLTFTGGLPHLKMRKYTTEEYLKHPHVFMTSDKEWNSDIYNMDVDPNQFGGQLGMLPHKDYDQHGDHI